MFSGSKSQGATEGVGFELNSVILMPAHAQNDTVSPNKPGKEKPRSKRPGPMNTRRQQRASATMPGSSHRWPVVEERGCMRKQHWPFFASFLPILRPSPFTTKGALGLV